MGDDVVRLNEHFDRDEDGLWVTYKDYKQLLDKFNELEKHLNKPAFDWSISQEDFDNDKYA